MLVVILCASDFNFRDRTLERKKNVSCCKKTGQDHKTGPGQKVQRKMVSQKQIEENGFSDTTKKVGSLSKEKEKNMSQLKSGHK